MSFQILSVASQGLTHSGVSQGQAPSLAQSISQSSKTMKEYVNWGIFGGDTSFQGCLCL